MYITRVELENVRCFESLELDFGKPWSSALIVGDNGDGKSTLLRSIAIGLCDESSASALHRELFGNLVRRGKKTATIRVWLSGALGKGYLIETTIDSLKAFERVTQKVFEYVRGRGKIKKHQENFPWDQIFVTAYGAGIRTIGAEDYEDYLAVDAVYPLFKYSVFLQNPELVVRRFVDHDGDRAQGGLRKREEARQGRLKEIKLLLARILNLDGPNKVHLTRTGLEIDGPWGRGRVGALGDGYNATITWTLDLLSWWFLYPSGKRKSAIKPAGIVLIDEVEQHLHPRWQITIMNSLCKQFPELQVIATTHSPLVMSGSGEIPIHRLRDGRHDTLSTMGWRAEDIYRIVMGLRSSSRSASVDTRIDEYRRLYLRILEKKATQSEKAKFRRLKRSFQNHLPEGDSALLTAEMKGLREFLRPRDRKVYK